MPRECMDYLTKDITGSGPADTPVDFQGATPDMTLLSDEDRKILSHPLVQTILDQVPRPFVRTTINLHLPIVKRLQEKADRPLVIAGYASVEVIDKQNEFIPISVLKESWELFKSNKDLMIGTLMHSNIPVIKILDSYKDSKGQMWRSQVDDTGLFIVAEVRDDIEKGKQTRELIEKCVLTGFSIGGEALASTPKIEGTRKFTQIDKMELHEIAVVDNPANSPSVFTIVKSLTAKAQGNEEVIKILTKMSDSEVWAKLRECIDRRDKLSEKLYPKSKLTDAEKAEVQKELQLVDCEIRACEHAVGEVMEDKMEPVVNKIEKLDLDFGSISKSMDKLKGCYRPKEEEKREISKPYPNEHACRLKEPGEFQEGSFRRISEGKLDIIIGKPKGEGKTEAQAYRYPKKDWSADAASSHCKKHGGKFEAAAAAKVEIPSIEASLKKLDQSASLLCSYGNKLRPIKGDK